MKFADSLEHIEFIPTGLFIDKLTGGIPRKKIFELYGDSGVGKSTLTLQIIKVAQGNGLKCLFADVEWSFDTRYAKSLGVDTSKLGIIQERAAEDVLERVQEEVETGKWDIVVIDSIGALTPRAEIEKGVEGKVIGGQASIVARFCRGIVPLLHMKNIALIVINHSFVDIMSGAIKTSGGKKLEYSRSVSIRLKNKMGTVLKSGDKKVGKVIVAECKRNKVSVGEGMEVEAQFLYESGFSASADLLDEAIRKGIITKKGASFFLGDEKIAYGQPKMRELMKDEAFIEKLKTQV